MRGADGVRLPHIVFASVASSTLPSLTDHLKTRYCVELLPLQNFARGPGIFGKLALSISSLTQLTRLLLEPAARNPRTLLITDSCHYACLLLAKLCSLVGSRKSVYLFNFYIHQMGTNFCVRRILAWLLRGDISIFAQSSKECAYFLKLSPTLNIRYFPYCRPPIELVDSDAIRVGDYVFAGGYTNRDFETFISAARSLPDIPFVLVSSRLNRITKTLPSNIQHFQDIPLRDFQNLLAGSRLLVIPLKDDVGSSGQMTALAGMQFSKTVVYPGFDVIAQYFENGLSGVQYRARSVESLRETIRELYSDAERLQAIGIRARQRWESAFAMNRFETALINHVEHAIRRHVPLERDNGI